MVSQRWMVVVDVAAEELVWEPARDSAGQRGTARDSEDLDAEESQPQQRQHPPRRPRPGRIVREIQAPAAGQSFDEWWDSLAEQTERVMGRLQRRQDERELANRLY